jgi:hypothetical protein
MWFQGLIIFAVVASNIHWQRTPNGYLPAMLGVGLAWAVTQVVAEWQTLSVRRRLRGK